MKRILAKLAALALAGALLATGCSNGSTSSAVSQASGNETSSTASQEQSDTQTIINFYY